MTRKKIRGGKERKERQSLRVKKEKVETISKSSSKYPVIALLNIRGLPDRILQSSRKKLRSQAEFSVAKNSVIVRALEKTGKGALASHLNFPTALVFTSLTPYSLYKFFRENKAKVAAKPGQIAPFDIIVPEGETELPPGPALSELKGAGINAQIKGGKIIVAKDSVVAKKGAKITEGACKALQKLGILPFEAMVSLVAAYDGKFTYEASVLDMDDAGLRADLLGCLSQSFNVSFNASFPTAQNIDALVSGAVQQARNMALNGQIYSDSSTQTLLAGAVLLGSALSEKIPQDSQSNASAVASAAGAPTEQPAEKPAEQK